MHACRLDIDHLALIDALAKTSSLVKSAGYLGITQPALSYRLREV